MLQNVEQDLDTMFASQPSADINSKIEEMAVFIAREDGYLAKLKKDVSDRQSHLDKIKEDLSMLMQQNGMEKVSLSNGLTPKAVIKTKYFKQSGVSDDQLFEWLRGNGIDDIIKPTVNFNTMQSTLSNFLGEIPEDIFNVTEVPTITMYGKSKFLASQEGA